MEANLPDSCEVTRAGDGPRLWDEGTGTYAEPARVVVYSGPCRFQVKADASSNAGEVNAGEREWRYLTATLQLPIAGSDAIRPNHVARATGSLLDPSIVGRVFTIESMYHKSHATHRRVKVREVVG